MYSESRLFCRLEGLSPVERWQRRQAVLDQLDLLNTDGVPVFEEAVQMGARFLAMPICILSIVNGTQQFFKAAVGLSQLGVMNRLAAQRALPLAEGLCTYVIDSEQVLAVANVLEHEAFTQLSLVQEYGVQAYAGIPLLTSQGDCIGTLAVMDTTPHHFSQQDIAFLELTARWAMGEFERNQLIASTTANSPWPTLASNSLKATIDAVRLNLIAQLTQDLRSPLTSIVGMASVLSRQIYGPLTDKQKEYTDIVRRSSQTLMNLVDDIIGLGTDRDDYNYLTPTPVDIEMLGQQVIQSLEQVATQREQQIKLTVEPGPRIWMLDKGKVRQLLYHLIFSVVQTAGEASTIQVHASRKADHLQLAVGLSNPWLGEGLPQALLALDHHLPGGNIGDLYPVNQDLVGPHPSRDLQFPDTTTSSQESSRELLSLLLSRQLTEMQRGALGIQGSPEAGYRYVITLPSLTANASTASRIAC
ncbi:GAF domain containing protein [Halomicronema hongdechloris C2206]|uniref:histidine kinase n=2 Tax=Halomicronema hongdechloris TaxID=1209493 RepID=A0A1Z3HR04_9CYAN|nr:GAF domain containing protein [Halomicronema hongdechloris C2206]